MILCDCLQHGGVSGKDELLMKSRLVSGDPKEIGEDGLLHINSGETAATYGYTQKSVAPLSEII